MLRADSDFALEISENFEMFIDYARIPREQTDFRARDGLAMFSQAARESWRHQRP